MSDVHTQQFQTVQQVAATIDALTQRLSDLRQLADFMSKSEAMAAELAAHRQVAEHDHHRLSRRCHYLASLSMASNFGNEPETAKHGRRRSLLRSRSHKPSWCVLTVRRAKITPLAPWSSEATAAEAVRSAIVHDVSSGGDV